MYATIKCNTKHNTKNNWNNKNPSYKVPCTKCSKDFPKVPTVPKGQIPRKKHHVVAINASKRNAHAINNTIKPLNDAVKTPLQSATVFRI